MEHRQIPLTQGKFALVDATDYEWLMQWRWYAARRPRTNIFYVQRQLFIGDGRCTTLHMHRVIMGLEQGDKRQCDHKDRDTLNNTRENLRICSRGQNQANTLPRNSSGIKGAYFRKDTHKWQAQIFSHGKLVSLGCYMTPEEAGNAYAQAAIRVHGDFARTS